MGIRIAFVIAVLAVTGAVYEHGEKVQALGELANARANIADSLDQHTAEIAQTIDWLNDFYRASEGLQRPNGIWIGDRPDSTAIAVWIVDVYMANRLRGRTVAEARQMIEDAIRHSDEWRTKHATAATAR